MRSLKSIALLCLLVIGMVSAGIVASPRATYAASCGSGQNQGAEYPDGLTSEQIDLICNGGACESGSFLGLPKWYKYIESEYYYDEVQGDVVCQPTIDNINDIWRVVAAVLEILLRIASLLTIGYIVYAGGLYITSQGQPDKTKQALSSIYSALIGLAITIAATALVSFIAGRF